MNELDTPSPDEELLREAEAAAYAAECAQPDARRAWFKVRRRLEEARARGERSGALAALEGVEGTLATYA